MTPPALHTLNAYLDTAPRPDCEAIDAGAFTLFVSRTPWPYYARPKPDHSSPIAPVDIDILAATCNREGVGLAIEWVHELHPELARLVADAGLAAGAHALMCAQPGDLRHREVTAGHQIRITETGEQALVDAVAVTDVAFASQAGGTTPAGTDERDSCRRHLPADLVTHVHDRARRGLTVTAVAETTADGVVAAGSHQPLDGLTEILAVATLPSARKRGLAGSITIHLAEHAFASGNDIALLSAQNPAVERLYARLGFRRVGTAMAAERQPPGCSSSSR